MSTLALYLLGAINLGVGIYSLLSTLAYCRYARRAHGAAPPSEPRPSVVLFVPCCGDEDGLEENLRSLVEQEYAPLAQLRSSTTLRTEATPTSPDAVAWPPASRNSTKTT